MPFICMANVACGRDTGATHEHRAVAPRRCDRRTAGGVAVTGQCVGLFALWGFCDPSPFRSIKGCFRRWSSPNNLPASVGNFGQIGTLPHHQAVDPRSSRAPGPDFGAHGTVVLHLECDAKTAQFRGQIASGRRASAPAYRAIIGVMIAPPAPPTPAPIGPARANPATPPAAPPLTASCIVVQPESAITNATIATTFLGPLSSKALP